MVAISVDSPDKNQALRKRLGLTYPVYSDADLTLIRKFGIENPKHPISLAATYVVNTNGKVVFRFQEGVVKRPPVSDLIAAVRSIKRSKKPPSKKPPSKRPPAKK